MTTPMLEWQKRLAAELRQALGLRHGSFGVVLGGGCGRIVAPDPELLERMQGYCTKHWRRLGIALFEDDQGEMQLALQFRLGRFDEWACEWLPMEAFSG